MQSNTINVPPLPTIGSRAIAREKAITANKMIPQLAPWSPALLRGYPHAVSHLEGVPHTFESIVGGFGARKMAEGDFIALDFIAEGE